MVSGRINYFNYASQAPAANWQELQRNASMAANPNQGQSGSNQYGTALSDAQGNGLLGYTVNGKFVNGNYTQDGSLAGANPVYGVQSFTATPELRSPDQYRDYLNSDAYKVASFNAQDAAKDNAKHSAFKSNLFGGLALGTAALAGPALFGALGAGTGAGASSLGSAASGIGSALTSNFATNAALSGALTGGLSGLASGGLKGALIGGATGGLTGGYGNYVGGGLGLSGAPLKGFTSALSSGAGNLAAGGDLKSALLSAGIAGAGGYAAGGGLDGVLGEAPQGQGPTLSGKPLNGSGSGFLGAVTRQTGASNSLGGNMSSYLSPLLSAGIGTYTNERAKDEILKQQQRNVDLLSPFLSAKFEPGDLTQDPGYQFQLAQGNKALDRTQSARGNYFSGDALRAAQDYGQGLASTTYGDAYNRFLQGQQQKLGAAGALTGVNDAIGNTRAGALVNQGNVFSGSLGALLGGGAVNNQGALMGQGNNDLLTQLIMQLQANKKG